MSTATTLPGYYTIREAASILDRDVSQICRYIKAGLLPAVDLGHQLLIEQIHVHQFTPPLRGNPEFRKESPD